MGLPRGYARAASRTDRRGGRTGDRPPASAPPGTWTRPQRKDHGPTFVLSLGRWAPGELRCWWARATDLSEVQASGAHGLPRGLPLEGLIHARPVVALAPAFLADPRSLLTAGIGQPSGYQDRSPNPGTQAFQNSPVLQATSVRRGLSGVRSTALARAVRRVPEAVARCIGVYEHTF
jgi:hypothetical protein